MEKQKPQNIILECVTGSKMYNLDTPESDEDIKGIFINPTEDYLGLSKPRDVVNHTDPDWDYHEVGKFINEALGMNPTYTELLWAENYRILTPIGKKLVDNRHIFLSQLARKTYYGYAKSQLERNYRNASHIGEYRMGKHARHIFRLLMQGKELLETGHLRVRCTQEEREYIFSFMKMDRNELYEAFEKKKKEFDDIVSILPEKPDYEKANNLLIEIRKEFF